MKKDLDLSPIARFLRLWLRAGIRGGNRTARTLAGKFSSLRAVPIQFADCPPVYMDLREWSSHELLKNSPWKEFPREQDEQGIFKKLVRPGDVVYDIGANIGMHSALLSRLVGPSGHVYVFEPNPALIPALVRTVDGMGNGTLFPVALSDRTGKSTLFVAGEDHSLSSLSNWTSGRFAISTSECDLIPLDILASKSGLRPPDFIKCDVEGAELDVFRGATNLLDRPDAPTILFEANVHTARGFGRSVSDGMLFLRGLHNADYQFFLWNSADGKLDRLIDIDPVHSNIVAISRSEPGRFF